LLPLAAAVLVALVMVDYLISSQPQGLGFLATEVKQVKLVPLIHRLQALGAGWEVWLLEAQLVQGEHPEVFLIKMARIIQQVVVVVVVDILVAVAVAVQRVKVLRL
jgi:hypothetical protein